MPRRLKARHIRYCSPRLRRPITQCRRNRSSRHHHRELRLLTPIAMVPFSSHRSRWFGNCHWRPSNLPSRSASFVKHGGALLLCHGSISLSLSWSTQRKEWGKKEKEELTTPAAVSLSSAAALPSSLPSSHFLSLLLLSVTLYLTHS